MNKFIKIIVYSLGILLLIVIGFLTYVKVALPDVGPPPDIKIVATAEKIERGSYLAHHVTLCMDCHSTRDWSYFSGPMVAGTEGKGGETFDQKFGFPGKYVAPNITPFNLKDWTDGEIFRAVTSGVSKDGRALFPIMPHLLYGQLDKNDIESIIAFIRTLKPIENNTEVSSSDFPMNFIINTIPKKPSFTTIPPQSDQLSYGKYIATASGCMECHTKQVNGKIVGQPYAGGFEFMLPGNTVVRSANITPDKETGIGTWTNQQFVERFKMYSDSVYANVKVEPGTFQTTMPWTMYAGMHQEDLSALFIYLQSLPPINNAVEKFTAANGK